MTRDEVVNLVRDALGFNKALSIDVIYRHMQAVQASYERGADTQPLPWFLFQHDATIETVVDQKAVALPENFIDFDEDFSPYLTVNSKTYPIQVAKFHEILPDIDEVSARPTHLVLAGSEILLFPVPNAEYTINFPHYARSANIVTSNEHVWFTEFPLLIEQETISRVARATRDEVAMKASTVNQERAAYLSKVESRRHALIQYTMGGRGA